VRAVTWDSREKRFVSAQNKQPTSFTGRDWLLTVELFSSAERPGFGEWMGRRECRLAAMFYDAIPLRFPQVTWPQSVQRHPLHMKMLAEFDRVFAISRASQKDLTGFWQWQGVAPRATVTTIDFGADFDGSERVLAPRTAPPGSRPKLLCVGIVEPRKNQGFLLDVCEALWRDGLDFELHIVGRLNPHFGAPLGKRFGQTQRRESRLHFHAAASDTVLKQLYTEAHAVALPTQAEGCGLPLLEALWHGVPCVCSDLPVLRENADDGGCLTATVNNESDWRAKLRAVLPAGTESRRLQTAAMARPLPRWAGTAKALLDALR
jgi:glycosyltransferase involved in cell wall biosynthesis